MIRPGDAIYRLLLRAFPAPFRRRHGEAMVAQMQAQRQALRGRPVALASFWVRAAADAARHGWAVRRDRRVRRSRGGVRMAILDDVRYAARGWRRDRAVTAVIIAILTVGIGANAIMFGVVDQLLLRPPAGVGDVDGVRRVYFGTDAPPRIPGQRIAFANNSYPFIAAVRDRVAGFSDASAISREDVTVGSGLHARPARVALVNAAYFPILGLRPAAGRFFTRVEDSETDATPVAVVSHGFWQRALSGNHDAIGRELRVEGVPLTVIGVAPRMFAGIADEPVDLWVPLGSLAPTLLGQRWASNPGWFAFELVARLAPDATDEQAHAQATATYRGVVTEGPSFDERRTAFTVPLERLQLPTGIVAEGRVGLWLLGVAAVVLLIAVANVTSLLLTRTLARRREIAVRLALGVSRARLLRQLLTESALLTMVATTAALAVAYAGGRVVQQILLPGFPWDSGVVDVRVLAVAVVAAALTSVTAGLAPAWQALSTDLIGALRATSRAAGGRAGLLRVGLLVTQVALCALLLVGAGLFIRSLLAVRAHDVGIDLDRVIQVKLPDYPGLSAEAVEARFAGAVARIAGMAGVERVTRARGSAPMTMAGGISIFPEGWTLTDTNGRGVPMLAVVPADYFATLGASIERGRGFTPDDEVSAEPVAVINRALATDFWSGTDPIGRCVRLGGQGERCTRVVGIVEDILLFDRVDTSYKQLYILPTHPDHGDDELRAILIRAESGADAGQLLSQIRQTIQSLSPDMPFVPVETMETLVAPQLQPWRLGTTMFLIFGGMALLIAAVGLYSATAHAVSQRRHEIGVRIALGASRRHIVVQIGRRGAATIAAGMVLGLALAAVATRWLTDLLYETAPRDPVVFAAVAVVLAVAGVSALVVPARRSTAIDPLIVLKAE